MRFKTLTKKILISEQDNAIMVLTSVSTFLIITELLLHYKRSIMTRADPLHLSSGPYSFAVTEVIKILVKKLLFSVFYV